MTVRSLREIFTRVSGAQKGKRNRQAEVQHNEERPSSFLRKEADHSSETLVSIYGRRPNITDDCNYTRVGTLIVATICLQLIQNRYMFRSFIVLQCSYQHCVQPVASDVEVVGYL